MVVQLVIHGFDDWLISLLAHLLAMLGWVAVDFSLDLAELADAYQNLSRERRFDGGMTFVETPAHLRPNEREPVYAPVMLALHCRPS